MNKINAIVYAVEKDNNGVIKGLLEIEFQPILRSIIEKLNEGGIYNIAIICDEDMIKDTFCSIDGVRIVCINKYDEILALKENLAKSVIVTESNIEFFNGEIIKNLIENNDLNNDKIINIGNELSPIFSINSINLSVDLLKTSFSAKNLKDNLGLNIEKTVIEIKKECDFIKLDNVEDEDKVNNIKYSNNIKSHIKNGVRIINKDGVIITSEVNIGVGTKILPGTIIKGKTIIGKNCTIGPNTIIDNSYIYDNIVINSSQVYNSIIKNNVTIGPFCHIRPNSVIDYKVKIGDFVEIKNSNIGAGCSVSHLTYVGDSDVGKNVNFGCGVVTVNYDGVNKNRCKIKDGAFIGCNTNLIAPVTVDENSYTAAGSTITKDVHKGELGIARARQKNLEGFANKKLKGRKLKVKESDG